ncbi:hypothetical protein GE061_005951 [Apolygus lucorum]|uniref:HTH psq-type domain-containing protein n=1 Tax=Apolygus lucorum TaxID=248454 RepID=A0A8S9WSL6_APOLU|nr:hypothetical protein GE061_005951 [Apolygus lucorum]
MSPNFRIYTAEQLTAALADVSSGTSILSAAKHHKIPFTSLYFRVKGKRKVELSKMGPTTQLTTEEEEMVVTWVMSMAKAGFPVTRKELVDSVETLVEKLGRGTKFKNNRPGHKWFNSIQFSSIQPNVNSENGMLSNDMIIESIFDLEGLDITHKDYAERDREDRDEVGKTRETESEDYAESDGEDRDEEGKTREKESEDNIIDGEDSGKKNLKGSFVLATFQKPRGSFNMVCEVVSQDNTFASVFTYGQVTRNVINRFARTSRETTAIRLDQILEILPSPTKFGFGNNIKYEFPVPPLRLM